MTNRPATTTPALLTHIERLLTIIDGPATPDHFEVHPGDDPAEIEAFEAGGES